MKRISLRRISTGALVLLLASSVAWGRPASELLSDGVYAMEIEGDLGKAIELFDEVIDAESGERNHTAQAMYHKGMCFMMMDQEQKARATFEALVNEFKDQTQMIAKAQSVLNDLLVVDPAAVMPVDTLGYLEIGDPGHQAETILKMIEGTPIETSLQQIGSGGNGAGALFNPNMLAELKKIKGLAVGVQKLNEGEPDLIIVMYPGKSDALWGLIKMGLGMASVAGDPIGNFQTGEINGEDMGYAYDDNALIVMRPHSKLAEAVAMYSGQSSKKSLVDNIEFMARASKETRQKNMLTIWQDMDAAYSAIMALIPPEHVPTEIAQANALMDFENIDDLLISFVLDDNQVDASLSAQLKPGHQCWAYNLLRTGTLSESGFAAVPEDSYANLSFCLTDDSRAKMMGQLGEYKTLTSLELIRGLVTNVEQVNLFMVPTEVDEVMVEDKILSSVGITLTSHSPQRTEEVLDELLGVLSIISVGEDASGSKKGATTFDFDAGGKQRVTCYRKRLGNSNVLTFDESIVDLCTAAAKKDENVLNDGPLQESLSKLQPNASKVLAVNVAGFIELVRSESVSYTPEDQKQTVDDAWGELAEAFEDTVLKIVTEEADNELNLKASLTDLPTLNDVYAPLIELHEVEEQVKNENRWKKEKGPAQGISKASKAINVDGNIDTAWSEAEELKFRQSLGAPADAADLHATARMLYDDDYLYVMMNISDANVTGKVNEMWQNDGVEIFLDADNSKTQEYQSNDYHFLAAWKNGEVAVWENKHKKHDIAEWAMEKTEAGYVAEARIPWNKLGAKPEVGASVGIELTVNDSDDGLKRKSKLSWREHDNVAWQSPMSWGTAYLREIVGESSAEEIKTLAE